MNTRIFTKLLQKAGTEVIEAFRDYIKSPKALNEVEPTLNKRELGKFLNKTIKPLVKDKDTTITIGRSKSKPKGEEINLVKFLENSLSKKDKYTKTEDVRTDKINLITGKPLWKTKTKSDYKKRENQWKTEEEDLQNFLTTKIDDLLPGSVMRKANIGRLARGEPEFIWKGYKEPTVKKIEDLQAKIRGGKALRIEEQIQDAQKELNADTMIRLLYNKLKGRTGTGITTRDILKYLKEGTLDVPAAYAKKAIADPDPQMVLPLGVKPKTKFGVRGFKGESPDEAAWQRFTKAVEEDPEAFPEYKVNPETGRAEKISRFDPDAILERQQVGETQTPSLPDIMQGRYGVMAEFEPAPGDVKAYRADLKPIYERYRTQLQSSFGEDFKGMSIQEQTLDSILKLTPEEKALLSPEEKLIIGRTKQIYHKAYDRARKQGASPSEADEIAREEAITVIATKSIDEDFSYISPEKVFLKREQISQIRDPKKRAAAELEEVGSRIVDPVDLRPSRQYSLNDLVPDPNIRQRIREQFKPEELEILIQEFLNPTRARRSELYRTQGDLTRHISDIPPEGSTGVARINPRALITYTQDPKKYMDQLALRDYFQTQGKDVITEADFKKMELEKDFINFLLGERRYAKGGRVKAKKKKKRIPKILQKRNIKGKRKAQRAIGTGAALRGWGAVRRVS